MITFTKGKDTKILSEESKLIEILLATGWTKETQEKEVKNGKSGKSGS